MYVTTNLSITHAAPSSLDVDAVVIGVVPGDSGPALAPGAEDADKALGGRLAEALKAVGATGKAGELVKLPSLGALTAQVATRLASRLKEAEKRLDALEKGRGSPEEARRRESADEEVAALRREREEIRRRIGKLVEVLDGLE